MREKPTPLPPVYAELAELLGGERHMQRRPGVVDGKVCFVVPKRGAHESVSCVMVWERKADVERSLLNALESRARLRLQQAEARLTEQRATLARTESEIAALQAALGSL